MVTQQTIDLLVALSPIILAGVGLPLLAVVLLVWGPDGP